jgi:hypothetical protein
MLQLWKNQTSCQKLQEVSLQEKKELAAMNKKIVHD